MANKETQASQQYISCVLSEDGDELFDISFNKDLTIKALKDTIRQERLDKLDHLTSNRLKLHLISLGDNGTLDDVEGKRNVPEGSTKMGVSRRTLQHYMGDKSLDTCYIFVEFQPPVIKVFCWVEGDKSAFSIKINSDETIDDLKEAIVIKNSICFPGIAAKDLQLFKANIPDAEPASIRFDFNNEKVLLGSDKLWIKFNGDFKDGLIHIAIKRPGLASVISCNVCFGRSKHILRIDRGQTLEILKERILKEFNEVLDGIYIKLYLENDSSELENMEHIWRDAEAAGKRNKFGHWVFDLRVETDAKDFSSYRKLKTILAKLGIEESELSILTQPSVETLEERDETLINHLKKDIVLRWTALKAFTSRDNEAKRDEFISPFLISAINSFDEPTLKLSPQFRINGSIGKGPVDYTIEYEGKVICVTECKARELDQGVSQNLAQLNSAAEHNTKNRKRKLPEDTDEQKQEALYGIVSTGDVWIFLLFLYSADKVQVAISEEMNVTLGPKPGPKSPLVHEEITEIYKVVKGMLQDQIMAESGSSVTKYERMVKRIKVK